jgi:hypothetical protein
MRKERVVLEDRVDAALPRRDAIGILAENRLCRRSAARNRQPAEAGGLAGTGRAEHGEELALGNVEIDLVDCLHIAEMARHVAEGTAETMGILRKLESVEGVYPSPSAPK